MNIFALEKTHLGGVDWVKSAESLDNVRVVKMVLETTQILSTAINKKGVVTKYKPTHANHPSVIWAEKSASNYLNLLTYGFALCEEYTKRFSKQHACYQVLHDLRRAYKTSLFRVLEPTPLPLVMPDEFKTPDLVSSYRLYYASKPNIRYPKNKIPSWFINLRGSLHYTTI